MGSQHWEGKVDLEFHLQLTSAGKGEKIRFFLKRRIPGYISDSPKSAPSSEVVGQHKRNFMFSYCCLVSFCFLGVGFGFTVFFLIVLNFIFCF